jgi:hypothetical protein
VKRALAAVGREDAAAAVGAAMDATRASEARALLERLLAR